MKRSARIALVVVSSFASLTFAQSSVRADDELPRVALNAAGDARVSDESLALDRYAGRYHTANGLELIVVPENGALTVELPASFGLSPLTLRSNGAGSFAAVDSNVRVTFETDGDGNVAGLLLHMPDADQIVAGVRSPFRRGIVTIYDVVEDAGVIGAATT